MTKIIVSNIDSVSTTEFKDPIESNGSTQWFDTYGVIKTATTTVNTATISTSVNAVSVGPITVSAGDTITVQGDWRIL
tara:strand:- start:252 stop:485 length:234 start_codon:yes stop_codon:yes gene_type:complete